MVVDPRAHPAHRHHAICQDAAARRPRGGADLRRRSAAEIQQPDPRYPRRPLREGDLLPGRTPGQRPIPKACARCATPATPSPPTPRTIRPACIACRSSASRQEIEQGIASVTAALGDGTAPAPFLRIPGLRAQRRDRGNMPPPKGCRSGARIFPADDWRHVSCRPRLRPRDAAAGGQGKGHPAAARHPAAHGRGAAEDPARTEGARLSHRPCGAGHRRPAGDADRAAAMAVASAVGDGGDLALAEDSEVCCRPARRHFPSPHCPISIGARPISASAIAAARARRSLPPAALWPRPTASPPADTLAALPVPAASLFRLPGIGAPDSAGLADASVVCRAGSLDRSRIRKSQRQVSPP